MEVILLEKIQKLESQIEADTAKLEEMRFNAELLRCRLSEATLKWGTATEKELLTHPKFAALMSRLSQVII